MRTIIITCCSCSFRQEHWLSRSVKFCVSSFTWPESLSCSISKSCFCDAAAPSSWAICVSCSLIWEVAVLSASDFSWSACKIWLFLHIHSKEVMFWRSEYSPISYTITTQVIYLSTNLFPLTLSIHLSMSISLMPHFPREVAKRGKSQGYPIQTHLPTPYCSTPLHLSGSSPQCIPSLFLPSVLAFFSSLCLLPHSIFFLLTYHHSSSPYDQTILSYFPVSCTIQHYLPKLEADLK